MQTRKMFDRYYRSFQWKRKSSVADLRALMAEEAFALIF